MFAASPSTGKFNKMAIGNDYTGRRDGTLLLIEEETSIDLFIHASGREAFVEIGPVAEVNCSCHAESNASARTLPNCRVHLRNPQGMSVLIDSQLPRLCTRELYPSSSCFLSLRPLIHRPPPHITSAHPPPVQFSAICFDV